MLVLLLKSEVADALKQEPLHKKLRRIFLENLEEAETEEQREQARRALEMLGLPKAGMVA